LEQPTPAPASSARRPLWRRPLGWALIALLALLVLIALLPSLAGGFAASKAQTWFAKNYHGRLELQGLDLSWTGRQKLEELRLLDESGARIARAALDLPSLWTLLRSGGKRLGKVAVELDADLVADDQGVTNLDRALAARMPAKPAPPSSSKSKSSEFEQMDLELDLRSNKITWSDANTRALGQPLSIENLRARALLRSASPLTLDLEGGVLGSENGRLRAHAKLSELSSSAPKLELDADLAGVPTALVDTLARQGGLLRELLGAELELRAKGQGSLQAGQIELQLRAPRTRLDFQGSLAEGRLQGRSEAGQTALKLEQSLDPGLAKALETRFLPSGAKLRADASGAGLTFEVERLDLDVAGLLERMRKQHPLSVLERSTIFARASALGLELEHPALASVGSARMDRCDASLRLDQASESGAASVLELGALVHGSLRGGSAPGAATFKVDLRAGPLPPGSLAKSDGDLGPVVLKATVSGLTPELAGALGAPPAQAALLGGPRELQLECGLSIAAKAPGPLVEWAAWPARIEGAVDVSLPAGAAPASDALGACSVRCEFDRSPAAGAPVLRALGKLDLGGAAEFQADLSSWPDESLAPPTSFDAVQVEKLPKLRIGLTASDVDVPRLERLMDAPNALAPHLGERITAAVLRVDTRALPFTLDGELQAPGPARAGAKPDPRALFARAGLAFDGRFLSSPAGEQGSAISATLPVSTVLAHLGEAQRSRFVVEDGTASVTLHSLRAEVQPLLQALGRVPPPSGQTNGASGVDLPRLLSALALKGELRVEPPSGAARRMLFVPEADLALERIRAQFDLSPAEGRPRALAELELVGPGDVRATIDCADAAALAALTRPNSELPPVSVRIEGKDVPTSLAKRWLGAESASKLGNSLAITGQAKLGAERGAFDTQLELKLAAGGQLQAKLAGGDLPRWMHFTEARSLAPLAFDLDLRALPTAIVQGWTGPGLVGKVGDHLDARATGTLAVESADVTSQFELELSSGGRRTSAKGTLRASEPFRQRESLPPATIDVKLEGLDLLAQFLPPERSAELREIAGTGLTLRVENRAAAAGATDLSLALEGARVRLTGSAKSAQGVVRATGNDRIELALTPSAALLDKYVGASLPPGAALRLESQQAALTMRLAELELPIDFLTAEPPASLASAIERARAQLELALPDLVYTHPPTAGSTTPGTSVPLRSPQVRATLAPGQGLSAHVTGQIEATPPGLLDFTAETPEPAAWLDPLRRSGASVRVAGAAKGLPTALVDALAAQNGLIVDALGPELELALEGAWPSAPDRELSVKLKSQQASLDLRASLDGKLLKAIGGQGLEAQLPLSPLVSQRVVGSLVPMLVQISKPAGARPVGLSAKVFSLPLDGELSKLDAEVVLDLNDVLYSLFPELESSLALAGGSAARAPKLTTLAPLNLKIEKGVCRYDRFPLRLGGQELLFKGSIDLAQRKYSLQTKLPLELLGSKVERELDRVREYLDPKTMVPLEIGGTWDKPRVRVGKDFLEDVVKKAAEQAIGKGLEDLLGGKKKKD
jgi:hypothetical protein